MASSNAVGNAREFISPSDLTFSWGSCHRCLWLNYNHGLRTPGFMPLVGDLANMQENYFAGKTTADIAPVLPEGKVADLGGWVKSSFISDFQLSLLNGYMCIIGVPASMIPSKSFCKWNG